MLNFGRTEFCWWWVSNHSLYTHNRTMFSLAVARRPRRGPVLRPAWNGRSIVHPGRGQASCRQQNCHHHTEHGRLSVGLNLCNRNRLVLVTSKSNTLYSFGNIIVRSHFKKQYSYQKLAANQKWCRSLVLS